MAQHTFSLLIFLLTRAMCGVIRNDCHQLISPENGAVCYSAKTGSIATYTCEDGYELVGSNYSVCMSNLTWSQIPPICQDIDECTLGTDNCDANAACLNTDGAFTCNCNFGFNGDGVICTGGLYANCSTNETICAYLTNATCNGTICICATGYYDPGNGTCLLVDCGSLTAPANGHVNTASGTGYLHTASYTCDTGYQLIGPNSRICQANGSYSQTAPVCEIFDCGNLPDINDGSYSASGGTTYSQVAVYTCDVGYSLEVGDSVRVCADGGNWNGTEPTCLDDDECLLGTDNCHNNALCDNSDGSFTCTCKSGYSGNGLNCTDDDECTLGTDNCHNYALCDNTDGSFTCTCKSGYSGNGLNCTDIDECTVGTDNCDVNAACSNTDGSFSCNCNSGFIGNGVTCAGGLYANCSTNETICAYLTNATCNGPICICAIGYYDPGNGTCLLVDCGSLTAPANGHVNTASGTGYLHTASYTCDTGYELIGPNSRICQANGTYSQTAPVCEIFDCGNLPDINHGSYSTSGGTTYSQVAVYTCDVGYSLEVGDSVRVCADGGNWNGTEPTCLDDDECLLGTDNCHNNALCDNTVGSFTCTCKSGYSGNGLNCTDDDECLLGTDNCHNNALCDNSDGSFTCTCKSGYSGNGLNCTDDDECTLGTDNCHNNALCDNTEGSFTCSCKSGYNGNGLNCTDADECSLGTDDCHINALCENTDGSFTCSCKIGYSGNGLNCTGGLYANCSTDETICADLTNATCNGSLCICITGYYDPGNETCLVVDCGSLADISNGVVSIPDGTTYGQKAIYSCSRGYSISDGDQERVCLEDGTWNGTVPTCSDGFDYLPWYY